MKFHIFAFQSVNFHIFSVLFRGRPGVFSCSPFAAHEERFHGLHSCLKGIRFRDTIICMKNGIVLQLKKLLPEGLPLFYYDEIDSTQSEARRAFSCDGSAERLHIAAS